MVDLGGGGGGGGGGVAKQLLMISFQQIFTQSGPKSPNPSPPRAAYGKQKRSGLRYYFRPRADCPGGYPALGQKLCPPGQSALGRNVLGGQPIYYSWPTHR